MVVPSYNGLLLAASIALVAAPFPPGSNPFGPGAKPTKPKAPKLPKKNQKNPKQKSDTRSQPPAPPPTKRGELLLVKGTGMGRVTMDAPALPTGPVALAGFDFGFSNGDHKIESIRVIRDDDTVLATFADDDGNDAYEMKSWHRELSSARVFKDHANGCATSCDVKIEKPRAGEVFVLLGFRFDGAGDRKFGRMALRPSPERGRVRAEFNSNRSRGVGFDVSIQYAYVPGSAVRSQYSANKMHFKANGVVARKQGKAVLQGFDVFYIKDGQFLDDFAIHPRKNDFRLELSDKSDDDWASVVIDYAILK